MNPTVEVLLPNAVGTDSCEVFEGGVYGAVPAEFLWQEHTDTDVEPVETADISPELAELRLLTEVDNLLDAMRPDGSVPDDVIADERINLKTAVYEIAMPYAVSKTFHRVEYQKDNAGRLQRVITWLGRNIVENAMNGKLYHNAPAAHLRVDVEVAEAQYEQEELRDGAVQFFISPKMSRYDAPVEVAKAEHLGDDDSLRASFAVRNAVGEIIGRRLESLLVRDISLEDWVAMFKDPNNLFGRALDIEDDRSALSIMKLFKQLELPEDQVTEGPVTLVAAVLPYITDLKSRESVERQLARFRTDQELYERQAERTAEEWLTFELELARSLHQMEATPYVANFIRNLQGQWGDNTAELLFDHAMSAGGFRMSRPLAAALEKAKQNILNGIAAVATGNEKVLDQMDTTDVERLCEQIEFLEIMRAQGVQQAELLQLESQLHQSIARQNLNVGGGCPGENGDNFQGQGDSDAGAASLGGREGSSECTFISKECPLCGAKNVITRSAATYVKGVTCGCFLKKRAKASSYN